MLKHTFTTTTTTTALTTTTTTPSSSLSSSCAIGNGLLARQSASDHHPHYTNTDIMETRNDFNINRYNTTSSAPTVTSSTAALQRNRSTQPLNISTILNTSKHSIGSSISPVHNKNGGLNISSSILQQRIAPAPRTTPHHPLNISTISTNKYNNISQQPAQHAGPLLMNQSVINNELMNKDGIKEMLVSLGLLCLISLLLALLSLIFLLKISPVTANDIREILRAEQLTLITAEEYVVVYEVTLALCALTLSLNLCCLLVCAIQFLFTVKLVKSPHGGNARTNKYLQKSSISRVCAVAGFFISIPVFLTGIILYTFIQFHSTPAIVTSGFIGLGIVFCGCAMVHNVFIWQREKTNAVKARAKEQRREAAQATQAIASSTQIFNGTSQNISITNPNVLNTSTNDYHPYHGHHNTHASNTNHHFNSNTNHNNMILINSSHLSQHSAALSTNGGIYGGNVISPASPGAGKLTVAVSGVGAGGGGGGSTIQHYSGQHRREASGSISPNGLNNNNNTSILNMIDKNSSSISPHELSTLV